MTRKKIILGTIGIILVTFFCTTIFFGYLMQSITGDAAAALRLLKVMAIVENKYVEPVKIDNIVAGAIKGTMDSLGDPHSIYMNQKMFKEFMIETEGSFGGVGIVLGAKDKVLTVVSPIEGTPGEKAGIKSGDEIIKIDGVETKGMALDEAVSKIRGPEGTNVVLTIKREQEIKDYTLTRSNIQIKTVVSKMLDNNIGYIRLSMFNETTGAEFSKRLTELEGQGMKGLVLDLRDNPGGLLDESVKVANKIVPKGPVVSVITKDGKKDTSYSNLEASKYPLAILVNGGSASASEIVAGAVQDTKAGTLIGTKTYGKGSVQTIIKLDNGSAIKLTIAKYYTPSGRSINSIGIEPDVKVEIPQGTTKDIQLDKAVEILKTKL